MRNVRLLIAYDGTHYAGWQRQSVQRTIQGVLEETIAVMTGAVVTLHGAGRTDAGVHALGMVANFGTKATIPCHGFLKGLNSMLPPDIRILAVDDVAPSFHARFNATGKCYAYHIDCTPVQMPHTRLYAAHLPHQLDLAAMRQGLTLLEGEHDFASFEASGSRDPQGSRRGSVRTIFATTLDASQDHRHITLTLRGDGFLRHMVRNIAGTLFDLGLGRIDLHRLQEIIAARQRAAAGCTAPARGLFLKEVFY